MMSPLLRWALAYVATSLLVGLGWALWYFMVYRTWPTGSYWDNLRMFQLVMGGYGWDLSRAIWDTQAWRWFLAAAYPPVITALLAFATYWALAHTAVYYGVARGRYLPLRLHRPSRLEIAAEALFRAFFAGAAATGFIGLLSNVPQWKELHIAGKVDFGWISPYQLGTAWVTYAREYPLIYFLHMAFGIAMGVTGIVILGFHLGRWVALRRRPGTAVGRPYMGYLRRYMAFLLRGRDPPGRPPAAFSFAKIFEYNGAAAGFIVIGLTGIAMAVWGPSAWGGVFYTFHVFEAVLAVAVTLVLLLPFLYLKEVEGASASPEMQDIKQGGG